MLIFSGSLEVLRDWNEKRILLLEHPSWQSLEHRGFLKIPIIRRLIQTPGAPLGSKKPEPDGLWFDSGGGEWIRTTEPRVKVL